MTKQIVIYMPTFGPDILVQAKIRRMYPAARFVTSYEEGAVMWQDALIGKLERR